MDDPRYDPYRWPRDLLTAQDDARGVGPVTYYWVFNNFGNGTATGVFSSFWEERP